MSEDVKQVARQVWRDGVLKRDIDPVVVELPVAFVYNGVSHAVMMSTPRDLDDLALGFSLSERILGSHTDLLGMDRVDGDAGIELRMEITARCFESLKQRRRSLAGTTGCGLCGIESLSQAIPSPVAVPEGVRIPHRAVQRALQALGRSQIMKSETGGVHGAAWCEATGDILLLREDVGRHNALDKLLGAMAGEKTSTDGFALISSRASYEMVAKAAACNVSVLAAVSAPTSLAVEYALQCGLTLVGFVQDGRQAVYTQAQRMIEDS